jgi:hypothetical protein
MDRRELLKMIAVITGSAVVGGEFFSSGCKNKESKVAGLSFSQNDIAFLDEIGETILPKTHTPGAKDAEVGKFMTTVVNDCYKESDQQVFVDGIKKLDEACTKMFGHGFMKADVTHRKELLTSLDKEAKEYAKIKKKNDPNHYFTMMKQLTLLGFFTSKPGLQQCFDYLPVPGKYDGGAAYKENDKMYV